MINLRNIIKQLLPYCVVKTLQRATNITEPKPRLLKNENGDEVFVCYLRSTETEHTPYSLISGRLPYRIFWDRQNIGLSIHFYTSRDIVGADCSGKKNYAILAESETIIPDVYQKLKNDPSILERFDLLFTYSDYLLKRFKNARFIPAGGVWGGITECDMTSKCKNISMVASNKITCDMHRFRLNIAKSLYGCGKVDVMGKAVSDVYVSINDYLHDYRYSIVIENDITDYYFTEKILNCFAAKVVPIYIGATKISQFFNAEGIIQIEKADKKKLFEAINNCSEDDYKKRKQAVEDNYQRVKSFLCTEDYLVANYPDIFNE